MQDHFIFAAPFIFVRHGETDWNKQKKVMGHQNIPLNMEGKKQAQSVYPSLKNYQIEEIYYSPLSRTKETAEIINENLFLRLTPLEYLKEWRWGIVEGMEPEKREKSNLLYYKGKTLREWALTPELINAESEQDFLKRVGKGLKKILFGRKFSLIVSHGGVYKGICKILNCEYTPIENCAARLFTFSQEEQTKNIIWKIYPLPSSAR